MVSIRFVQNATPIAPPCQERMIVFKTANQWMAEAALRPDPRPLWLTLWYEQEVCCLFADSNLGKSIYAVQIAEEISKFQKVCKIATTLNISKTGGVNLIGKKSELDIEGGVIA